MSLGIEIVKLCPCCQQSIYYQSFDVTYDYQQACKVILSGQGYERGLWSLLEGKKAGEIIPALQEAVKYPVSPLDIKDLTGFYNDIELFRFLNDLLKYCQECPDADINLDY